MSVIKVDTIQNTSGVEQYLAKAWVNFNSIGTVAIRADGNVSSITDNGVGSYAVNMSTALTDVNYSWNATSGIAPATGTSYAMFTLELLDTGQAQTKTTTAYKIFAMEFRGFNADTATCMTKVIR